MSPQIRACLLIMFCVLSWMAYSKIYTWRDSSGIVNYSDQPHQDAETVNLSTDAAPQKNIPPANAPLNPPTAASNHAAAEVKFSIEITVPKKDDTIRNPQGTVPVQVMIKPGLKAEDKIQIFLDDLPVGEALHSSTFALTGVLRGSHTVSAKLLDEQGDIKAESDSVTFFMMPPRTNMVPHKRVL